MDTVLLVVLVVLIAVLLAVVVVQLRRGSRPAAPDSDELRRLIEVAVAGRAGSGRHRDASDSDAADVPGVSDGSVVPGTGAAADARNRNRTTPATRVPAAPASPEVAAAADALQEARAAAVRGAEQAVARSRREVADQRAALVEERRRMSEEISAKLAAERSEMTTARQRLQASLEDLAEDQRRLAADRERLRSQEAELARSWAKVTGKQDAMELQAEQLAALSEELAERGRAVDDRAASVDAELTRVGGLAPEDAKAELLRRQEKVVRREAAMAARRIESEAAATAQQRARAIVADAIARVASDQTAQSVVSVVHLPADEIKGRIIGREGRNIRTFETVTGVNVIIDDTPEAVLLSCFDPVRREVGRITLEMLIEDGRIHPHRIEESFLRAHDEVLARCARAAENAMVDVGISDLHPELVDLLGRLSLRTSYGQNVLGHLVETAHIAAGMAAELGIDPTIAVRGAFLHDIGKALTHEAQGSHAIVGADLARRHGESDEVAHCIEAHHDEVPPGTVEAVLTQAADACSGGRPGARRESLESYVQRLERIEAIAAAKDGVEKVFAMQAGRELRVMVKPDVVDDLEAHVLAREVAKQIEEELTYPGQVRVTVIRESRATEVAR